MSQIKLNPFKSSFGPLQIVHDFKFVALNLNDDYSVIDTLDYDGKLDYIKTRVDALCDRGYGGIVMNTDYKNYLSDDNALMLAAKIAEYAKQKGLRVWIYDEQYYPSGSAGGKTLIGHPEYEAICLSCVSDEFSVKNSPIRVASPNGHSSLKFAVAAPIVNGTLAFEERIDVSKFSDLAGGLCWDAPNGEWKVWCFFVRALYEHTYLPVALRAPRRYISIYNKKAVEHFADVTFKDGYQKTFPSPLGETVEAIFTDEPSSFVYNPTTHTGASYPTISIVDMQLKDIPNLPYVPWDCCVFEEYQARYNSDITLDLPYLFEDLEGSKLARRRFYTLLSDLAVEALPKQLNDRFENLSSKLSGHYYGEEEFDTHPVYFGDVLEHLGAMAIPGCDCLGSHPSFLRYCTPCRVASSAAHINKKQKVLIEASNVFDVDQSITLSKIKSAVSMMFVHGINVITSYYGENILPPEQMKEFCRHTAALGSLLDGATFKVDTLLYYPFETLCENMPPQATYTPSHTEADRLGIGTLSEDLQKNQIFFDFINKHHLLSSRIENGKLITDYGEEIKNIVMPCLDSVDEDIAEFLCSANEASVNIWFDGAPRNISGLSFSPRFIENEFPKGYLSLKTPNELLTAAHFRIDGYDLYMLMNTGEDGEFEFTIPSTSENHFAKVLLETNSLEEIKPKISENKAEIKLNILGGECAFVCIY